MQWTHKTNQLGWGGGEREGGGEGRGGRGILYIYHMAFFGSKGSTWFVSAMQTIIVTYSSHA
jgi:hypothetical protein